MQNTSGRLLLERINTTYRRDFRYFNTDSFKRDLQEINWNFATKDNDIDLEFETFSLLFNKTLERHAPVKESASKEEKTKPKPEITNGIRKSIIIRDNLYKVMIKENNVITKSLRRESFKKYRNQIINIQ